MELGAHVWLRKEDSHWGWVPAVVNGKDEIDMHGVPMIRVTLNDDPNLEMTMGHTAGRGNLQRQKSSYFDDREKFEVTVMVDPEQLKTADHDDIKLRNLPNSYQLQGEDPEAGVITSPSTKLNPEVVGGVDDLIGLTHLHEPAILHALRLRYDSDIIYTSTGPILIAVNPFKPMSLYSQDMMDSYRTQGEQGIGSGDTPIKSSNSFNTPSFKRRQSRRETASKRLPPHVYQTADDAYRAMMRGLEDSALMGNPRSNRNRSDTSILLGDSPTDQSILVSGESGAGKTVTTKIVLNYFAMLSRRRSENDQRSTPAMTSNLADVSGINGDVSIEQQVLQSNPILESFGNARTIRNDNSSRFGKYIDIRFTKSGKLSGASIETYLLEKVRLIHPSHGERNYHVFYQFLTSATPAERDEFYLENLDFQDFKLLNQSGTYDRRDGVSDEVNHQEMLDSMMTVGFEPETIQSLMQLVIAVLFAGNMTFTASRDGESCTLDETDAAFKTAALLGVTFEGLSAALTSRVILAGSEILQKPLHIDESRKSAEALIKAVYGAAFDFIVEKVNQSIERDAQSHGNSESSIGVLDIFGFETFDVNNFEQLCINYTNEALQQQFNKYVFKLEQQEYEKEGILWKFISFPDNQDVLDLIDKKYTGIIALLDEQCILPKSNDEKFTRYIYAKCDQHTRFHATSAQRVDYKFSIEHYAGYVEYTTDTWLEKNKDQLPAAAAELLASSDFSLIPKIRKYVRTEDRAGRGTIATKSVGAQFSEQLKSLRARIDTTVPHYIRCLKPNDDLVPDYFEPKNIVEQLRCGGVLEAVRVSRAGYPTRYAHDVFLARYYILGDRWDNSPISPIFNNAGNDRVMELKRLISKIAYDLWESDHQHMQAILEAERRRSTIGSPAGGRYSSRHANNTSAIQMSGPRGPAFSLVVESSVMTPEEKQFRSKRRKKKSSLAGDGHNISRPETEEDFLALDFSSRCAVAGLQLGRNKVFLRREAFDRIEAMRSDKFFHSASQIQKIIRGKICRTYFLTMKGAAIMIQSVMRMKLSTFRIDEIKNNMVMDDAARSIQSAWRAHNAKAAFYEVLISKKSAAIIIQRNYRRYMYARNYVPPTPEPQGPSEDQIIKAVTAMQAMARGAMAREALLKAAEEESPAKSLPPPTPSPVQERQLAKLSPEPESDALVVATDLQQELYNYIQDENWAFVESVLDKHPELAESDDPKSGELPLHMICRHIGAWTLLIDMVLVLYPKALIHRDKMGALPIHHAAAHDNLSALEIIYSAYKEGVNDTDKKGRLPIHVAAEFDAVETVKFLLAKSPEGAYTMVYRPPNNSGGGLPLHIACRNYASIGVITALLAENFASAKRTDENGDLPLHLLLRCGEVVDQVVVKTLLTCFSSAVSRTDMNGDLPLHIALKNQCRSAVINTILMQFPEGAGVLNGEGHSPLFLSFQHNADDRTIMGLLNHAPELSTSVDRKTGLLPIQVATENEHSHFIVHNLLKRDMPIDMKEKVRAQLIPHHYSWNHIVANTEDVYHQVVTKILQACTQPQVLALAHVEGPDGKIALAAATPVCKHELRVMLRLFNTLEVVNQRPAYTNPVSDTQIFYALRYEPPAQQSSAFTILHDEKVDGGDNDYLEDWDDSSQVSALSRNSVRSTLSNRSQQSIEDKMRIIRKEKGQQVIAKLTSRSDVVERELKVRKEFHLSRHYVPAIISVHHTVQHAAYSEAMAEPGYCITMEGADTTAENLMLDTRKSGKKFPDKALKRIGISLLHMHEHGLVHGDFGTHNIGKFGSRWKLLGVGGSFRIGEPSDPNRGFYHPPESVLVENKRGAIGKKHGDVCVVAVPAQTTYDIWAYGIVLYEAVAGQPLSAYACRGKRAMSTAEITKIGNWDEHSVKRALRHIPVEDSVSRDLLKKLLHHDPDQRMQSMRDVLEHPFFSGAGGFNENSQRRRSESRSKSNTRSNKNNSDRASSHRDSSASNRQRQKYEAPKFELNIEAVGNEENALNGVPSRSVSSTASHGTKELPIDPSPSQQSARSSRSFRNPFRKSRKQKA
mmetsp:Transcript_670/g.950  ORF Transcript_670/g.950 Transcript_670/m.950 type:complete len:2042 (-) Transcript_670:110-6235(-)